MCESHGFEMGNSDSMISLQRFRAKIITHGHGTIALQINCSAVFCISDHAQVDHKHVTFMGVLLSSINCSSQSMLICLITYVLIIR